MDSNNDSSSSEDELINNNLLPALSRTAQLLLQNNVSSSNNQRRNTIQRDRLEAEQLLIRHYFADDSTYGHDLFRRRFRMSKGLFMQLVGDLEMNYPYFQTTWDATNQRSFSGLQKCTSTIRQLAKGYNPDSLDEYLNMSERTSREALENFCYGIVQMYKAEYLRRPTSTDIQKLYEAHEARHGFPGMLGSIDCTHWNWRNCLTELRGQYMRGDHQYPTMILEAVTSQDLWFWHAFYGVAGSNNDLNVLYQSPLFDEKYHGTGPDCSFDLNGEHYKHGYYLADGIYPTWVVFVKSYPHAITNKKKRFKAAQESARKDVERTFGVLKGCWDILKMSARAMTVKKTKNIMLSGLEKIGFPCVVGWQRLKRENKKKLMWQWVEREGLPPP
ncbi:uncharacterized protein LOC111898554 [Lactuca sativa]|uniref:uncharacterized protein LOC111898554 n=1 Tax=Lactuca sativa TaxID=4236 RepID=UPI0022AF11B3|nr:uncharacterized protein LOC111898554 [Lactuca sativa]